MLKLLIVDDEPLEREGLRAVLRHGIPESQIELARNGAIAVELAQSFRPDIILMDIKMPGMSGLEAVALIKEAQPTMKFIMVTAYEAFDYARQAIKLGVSDYLLKPSKASEIVAVVRKAIDSLLQERALDDQIKQDRQTLHRVMPLIECDVVTGLLYDHVQEVHIEEMLAMLGSDMTKEAFVLLVVLGNCSAETAYSAIKWKLRELGCGWVGAMTGRQVPIIIFRQWGTSFRAQAASLVQQLLTLQQRTIGDDGFIGIGNPYDSLNDIRHSFREALLATADASLLARHRFYEDMDLRQPASSIGSLDRMRMDRETVEQIRLGQWDDIRHSIHRLVDGFEHSCASLVACGQAVLEQLWIVYRTAMELGVEAERPLFSFQARQYYQMLAEAQSVLDQLIQSFTRHRSKLEPDIVGEIKQYIAEHSQEEISLETIAKRVQLSPHYISKMFKEQLGVNYIDFLTECRIDKAKALMLNPQLSMKEITFEVGYNDPNYFSKVFKKICGASPSEYRKMVLHS
ncbi:two component transcriptional regulator, AraC family [Paenibacillus curdlanolyticus YK9]|uniref:Two component transcriptional regulator, AraC family n=1 Tax=Paenibacillus curdlanolyticus YK9 TaxID=717606 RepID=E0I4R8_9BACL|nr:response regulator [Paenibacillus curdlanolyticus]EFM12599.1 two component transcriptional regulator, AraC family [Paenibacillus curdlanolyticus YK9]